MLRNGRLDLARPDERLLTLQALDTPFQRGEAIKQRTLLALVDLGAAGHV